MKPYDSLFLQEDRCEALDLAIHSKNLSWKYAQGRIEEGGQGKSANIHFGNDGVNGSMEAMIL
jgi:hypothetical protein